MQPVEDAIAGLTRELQDLRFKAGPDDAGTIYVPMSPVELRRIVALLGRQPQDELLVDRLRQVVRQIGN